MVLGRAVRRVVNSELASGQIYAAQRREGLTGTGWLHGVTEGIAMDKGGSLRTLPPAATPSVQSEI
jgi:hypothetical protein